MEFKEILLRAGEISSHATLTALTGGVSSDIFLIEDQGKKWVAKRALEKLKVSAEWRADVNRYLSEYRYMKTVEPWIHDSIPRLRSMGNGYFTMEFLGEGFLNWKQEMMRGQIDPIWGERAGSIMGTIHNKSWMNPQVEADFQTTENFEALRLESYLRYTGKQYPELNSQFQEEANRIRSKRVALVHGDFSPKNILIREPRIVLLDCEVAWYGDPSFDVAFLTNHLILKAIHLPEHRIALIETVKSFWKSYEKALGVDRFFEVSKAARRLQWMLMLARVDGKSPAEYLRNESKELIRQRVKHYLRPDFYPTLEQTLTIIF